MLRKLGPLALLLVAGAVSPVTATAAPANTLPKVQAGTTQSQKTTIKFVLANGADSARTVTIDGQSYTVAPHRSISVAAAQGAQVIGTGEGYGESGKVLFTVEKTLKGLTVTLN